MLAGGDVTFNRSDFDEDALLEDPARLGDELAAMSLMGGQRLVVLRDAGDKSAPVIKEALEGVCEAYLLVYAQELPPRSVLRKLFESDGRIAALPCYKDEGVGLSQLITQQLQQAGLHSDRAVTEYLTARLGGDRSMGLSELEKITLYFLGETQVSLEAIQNLVESDQETTLDEVCQAFALRHTKRFCETLDTLLVAGVQPIMFLRSIDRLLARIADIHMQMAQGKSPDQAVQALRPPVFFKQQKLFAQYARGWTAPQLQSVRHQIMRLELITKTKNETAEIEMKQGLLRLMLMKPPSKTVA